MLSAKRSRRRGKAFQPRFSFDQIALSWAGSFVGIALLAYLSYYSRYPLIAAPMGATSVLVFGVPKSPLAQPRNVVGGNILGAAIAVILVAFFGTGPWVMAIAVSTTIVVMKITRTVHPPAGAVALVGVMASVSWDYMIAPVAIGSILIVLWTFVFNNLTPSGLIQPTGYERQSPSMESQVLSLGISISANECIGGTIVMQRRIRGSG